jgi:high-affinity Fe2+/Pb2+ permease
MVPTMDVRKTASCAAIIMITWTVYALSPVQAFVVPRGTLSPSSFTAASTLQSRQQSSRRNMLENAELMSIASSSSSAPILQDTVSLLMAFGDQGQNLAGTFFQASLLPYLIFLYFLSFKANRIPATANFGFQFILLFVFTTIPSGIISKSCMGIP